MLPLRDSLVFRSLLSLDFFDSLLTKGKSRDKRERSLPLIQFRPHQLSPAVMVVLSYS